MKKIKYPNIRTKTLDIVRIFGYNKNNERICGQREVKKMYKHLEEALKSKGISWNAAAKAAGMSEATFRSKMSGRSQCGFTITEAITIKENLFPEMDIIYLFQENRVA